MLERLVAARKTRRLTQMQVARKLGLPQPRISDMETGQRRIDPIELAAFMKLYKKGFRYFVPGL
jgi:transcriptional regulator with XRE-family HTH domain